MPSAHPEDNPSLALESRQIHAETAEASQGLERSQSGAGSYVTAVGGRPELCRLQQQWQKQPGGAQLEPIDETQGPWTPLRVEPMPQDFDHMGYSFPTSASDLAVHGAVQLPEYVLNPENGQLGKGKRLVPPPPLLQGQARTYILQPLRSSQGRLLVRRVVSGRISL